MPWPEGYALAPNQYEADEPGETVDVLGYLGRQFYFVPVVYCYDGPGPISFAVDQSPDELEWDEIETTGNSPIPNGARQQRLIGFVPTLRYTRMRIFVPTPSACQAAAGVLILGPL